MNRLIVGHRTGKYRFRCNNNKTKKVSTRSGSYEIEAILDDVDRGTAIRCHLRDDCAEFSKEETIKRKSKILPIISFNDRFLFVRNREEI